MAPLTFLLLISYGCSDDTPVSELYGYNAFPDVVKTKSGKIVLVFYSGSQHASKFDERRKTAGGRIMLAESFDEGKTWSDPVAIIDTPLDDRDPSIFQARDGRLLINFFVRLATNRTSFVQTLITESSDDGKTWSKPKLVINHKATTSPIRELSDGRLALTVYEHPGGCSILFSKDLGRTWGDVADIGGYGISDVSEPDVLQLGNRLIAYMRSDVTMMRSAESYDGGKSWSLMNDCGFPGAAPYLYNHKNETVLLAHRIPTTSIKLWFPKTNRWTGNFIVDYDLEANGAYPSIAPIGDNKFVVAYYYEHVKDIDSSIRIRAIELVDDYIEVSDEFSEIDLRQVVTH